jgi:hypothetical protein
VTGAWNEYSITWNTQPASTTEHQIAVPAPSSGTDSLVQDVLPLVKDILNSEEGNHGFELILQNGQKYRSVRYASTATRPAGPRLTITYTQVNEAYYLKDHPSMLLRAGFFRMRGSWQPYWTACYIIQKPSRSKANHTAWP